MKKNYKTLMAMGLCSFLLLNIGVITAITSSQYDNEYAVSTYIRYKGSAL